MCSAGPRSPLFAIDDTGLSRIAAVVSTAAGRNSRVENSSGQTMNRMKLDVVLANIATATSATTTSASVQRWRRCPSSRTIRRPHSR